MAKKKDKSDINFYWTDLIDKQNTFQKSNPDKYFNYLFNEIKHSDLNLDNLINKLPKSNTISRQQSTRNINDAYQKEKLVFVLGAGVSLEFGVPSWNLLLQSLMVHSIEKENSVSTVLSKLFNDIFKPNPLIAGRYLQDYFEKADPFCYVVRFASNSRPKGNAIER